MLAPTINLTIFIMMAIIYLNELRHISAFIYNLNYIKDMSKIVMEQKCNNIYCEAETDRYHVAKNSYNLLLPNDVFNSKTYIIMTFVISILLYMYYYYLLFDSKESNGSNESNAYYYILNISLLTILLGIIIYRYVPNDEAGYLNYFKNSNSGDSGEYNRFAVTVFLLLFVVTYSIYKIKSKQITENASAGASGIGKNIIILVRSFCFLFSIVLIFNLMNIVMSFRVNTKPMLKTLPTQPAHLLYSLQQALKVSYDKEKLDFLNTKYPEEVASFKRLRDELLSKNIEDMKISTLSYILKILIAFDELKNIVDGGYDGNEDNSNNTEYITKLQNIIRVNMTDVESDLLEDKSKEALPESWVSSLSLIFDKKVNIPHNYNNGNIDEHAANTNNNNVDYVYTADISYDNPNLFYEKYWDMDDSFLSKYAYFTPTFLFLSYRPNLYKIMLAIIVFVILMVIIGYVLGYFNRFASSSYNELLGELYTTLQPLCAIVVLVIFIIIFISFNTNFNDKVVYKCLDSSYKRSLNKLNNIVVPYMRMYDNKIVKSNKNYLHHYIISNVFYSILSGNIQLYAGAGPGSLVSINETGENSKYYDIARIKSNRLKFAAMNNTILSNDNEFREYYKAKFGEIYKEGYDATQADLIYKVFTHIFADNGANITSETDIDKYFKGYVITNHKVFQIYCIIKKCFELFKEDKFNNNLIYFNNPENKQKGIDIDAYKKFKFYKYGDTVVPYKFILKLGTIAEYNAFVKVPYTETAFTKKFNEDINTHFGITISNDPSIPDTNEAVNITNSLAGILLDSDEEDLTTQASSMEALQDKNLLKIISNYLLILGHINYNRKEYMRYKESADKSDDSYMRHVYEKKTYYLYKLFSNTLYGETYEIDDTFTDYTLEGDITAGLYQLESITVDSKKRGGGYATAPTVVINPVSGAGSGAAAIAKLGTGADADKVTRIEVTVPGKDYTTPPTISFTDGTAITVVPAEADAFSDTSGKVYEIKLRDGKKGSGYKTPPGVTITSWGGAGSGAMGTAILGTGADVDKVISVAVTASGSGYDNKLSVSFQTITTPEAKAKIKTSLLITGDNDIYKNLTYIYNYLETKYVSVSSVNNRNYLMNIVKSINNKINDSEDEEKILNGDRANSDSKDSRYFFNNRIATIDTPLEYETEDGVLDMANNISTSSFTVTYMVNIVILMVYFHMISRNNR